MLAERLRNQKLAGSTLRKASQVIAWHGVIQAQDYAGAKWALALRAPGLTDDAIERAFGSGEILRTHTQRGTWHFVTRDDIRWILSVTAPRLQRINRRYGVTLGLDERTFTRAGTIIERALEGGKHLTRDELSAVLQQKKLDAKGTRLAHLVMDCEARGTVCSGPRRGKQFTYALVSERAPDARVLPSDAALAELTRRFFQSHAPATLQDYAWWSGLTMTDVRAGVALAGIRALDKPLPPQRVAGATFLLPNYDEYVIAYKDRTAIIDPSRARNLGVFTSLEYPHYLIIDGRVAGSWKREIGARSASVRIRSYEPLTRASRAAIAAEVDRYGAFVGLSVSIQFTR